MSINIESLIEILIAIVAIGIGFKIVKAIGSIIFKVAFILLAMILFYNYFL